MTHKEIAEENYNLAVSTYVQPEDTREIINIKELNKDIAAIVQRQSALRARIDAIVTRLTGKAK